MTYRSVDENYTAAHIRAMIEKGHKCFSVTRVDIVESCALHFISELDSLREINGAALYSKFHLINSTSSDDHHPRLYIVSSESPQHTTSSTAELIEMVSSIPKGRLAELLKKHFLNVYAKDSEDRFDKILADVKKEKGPVAKITVGPVYYNHTEISNIADLFLPKISNWHGNED